MINKNLVTPIKPKQPDVTMPLTGRSPEWEEYYEKLNEYEKDIELYKTKEEILDKLKGLEEKVKACLIPGDKEEIIWQLTSFGINFSGSVDSYVQNMEDSREKLAQLRDVLTNIYTLESKDTVGISYTNDEIKTNSKINDEIERQNLIKEETAEEISIQVIISEYANLSFDEQKKVFDALKTMGYEGDFGEMRKFVPAFEKINRLQVENSRLQTENKELGAKNGALEATIQDYSTENETLKSENMNLSDKLQKVLDNVKEYKDFVLQTVRDMPIIGKLLAKKIQKEEKTLGSGMEK